MANIIFSISIAVISLLSSCYSLNISQIGDQRLTTPCMFGPFRDTIIKCVTTERKFTGCILEGLDWFDANGALSRVKVLDSFDVLVIHDIFKPVMRVIIGRCVDKANLDNRNATKIGDIFVECLDGWDAFADIFPKVFCKLEEHGDKSDEEMESSSSLDKEEVTDLPSNRFRTISETTDEPAYNIFEKCELGPFRDDSPECAKPHGCTFIDYGYFTENNKVNISRVLDSIRPYIVNLGVTARINEFMTNCVNQANSFHGTKYEVGRELMACWIDGNIMSLFKDAFCPKII